MFDLTASNLPYIKRGDSLSKIANQFDTSVRAIKAANGLSSDLIRVGDKLVVPVSSSSTGTSSAMTAAPSDSISSSSTAPSFSASGARTHTVKSGEYPGKKHQRDHAGLHNSSRGSGRNLPS